MTRRKKAITNIITSLVAQIVTIACGLIAPRFLLESFGSEVYGATASIAQLLSYISLLEGGIGGVARAALYKPLVKKDTESIAKIIKYLQKFFFYIGLIFTVYTIIVALVFKDISSFQALDQTSTFLLVIVISISTFGQYFIGISYTILLQSDQKAYVPNIISMLTLVVNTALVVLLVKLNCNIVIVKLVSSAVFFFRPIATMLYVKTKYNLATVRLLKGEKVLKDKWTGLGQHIAYFVHSNTDIVVLTTISSLTNVSIYAVYYMIINHMQNLNASFGSGMEAVFGELYAKEETKKLSRAFDLYESLLSIVCITLFSTTIIMLTSFIKIYTSSITDANYIQPFFGVLMVISSMIYIFRLPYHNLVIAAGKFRQTRAAAYGEAAINIAISIVMVSRFGLPGVAIGTLAATLFRFIYYVFYVSKNILKIGANKFFKRACANTIIPVLLILCGNKIIATLNICSYLTWGLASLAITAVSLLITVIVYAILYKDDSKRISTIIKRRLSRITIFQKRLS